MRDMARLLRVRSIWERRAAAAVGEAVRESQLAEEAARTAGRLHTAALASETSDLRATRIGRLATHRASTDATEAARLASLRLSASRGAWNRTRIDVEAIEELERRRTESERAAAVRAEARELDELAVLRRRRP